MSDGNVERRFISCGGGIGQTRIPVLHRRGNAMRFLRIAFTRWRDLCTNRWIIRGPMNCILGIETHARLMHRLTTAGFRRRSRIGYASLFISSTESLRFVGKEEEKRTSKTLKHKLICCRCAGKAAIALGASYISPSLFFSPFSVISAISNLHLLLFLFELQLQCRSVFSNILR